LLSKTQTHIYEGKLLFLGASLLYGGLEAQVSKRRTIHQRRQFSSAHPCAACLHNEHVEPVDMYTKIKVKTGLR